SELLDYLAWQFMEKGWSIKNLHRLIMLSSVYQQSSEDYTPGAQIDSNNSLLWKMNRQRLDFEELRDSILSISGQLDLSIGGRPVNIVDEPFSQRRAVYGYIDRQNLPGLFRTFDFASPDTTSPQRFSTTVPQQALFLMNSPFVMAQVQSLTTNKMFQNISTTPARVQYLYQKIYQRAPAPDELQAAEKFLKTQTTLASPNKTAPIWQYGYGHFDQEKKVVKFSALSCFTNNQWQASETFPDPRFGHLMLNPTAGHPGNRLEHSAIRRWTSPGAATIKIEGTLVHLSDKGDGVLGRIVSSRPGELGHWIAQNGETKTVVAQCEVQRGDTIDFIVEMRTNSNSDTFQWAPLVSILKTTDEGAPLKRKTWSAQNDFEGPPKKKELLNSWGQYAQILLLSNEFNFID
ncbi:MAG: DUF1553 domain-containing protein, partial [Limisphaerales bacterium]